MDTHKKIREHISAMVDNELSVADVELAMAALQTADGQQAWHTYHRIGDALRAHPGPEPSEGFSERLARKLALESPHGKKKGQGGSQEKRDKRTTGSGSSMQASSGASVSASGPSDPGAPAEAVAVATTKPAIASVS